MNYLHILKKPKNSDGKKYCDKRKQGLNVGKYKKRNKFPFLYLTTYVRSLPKEYGLLLIGVREN